jgi:uncharacterized protein YlxW (UPF0749 family)
VHIAGEGCRLTLRMTRWESPELVSGPDARFRDKLRALLETVSGEATLQHLEEEFGAKVTLKAGVGELEVFVAELRVADVRTDQSHLARTLRELDDAVAAFGVRGNAYE